MSNALERHIKLRRRRELQKVLQANQLVEQLNANEPAKVTTNNSAAKVLGLKNK